MVLAPYAQRPYCTASLPVVDICQWQKETNLFRVGMFLINAVLTCHSPANVLCRSVFTSVF
jgi:hypothetical protein